MVMILIIPGLYVLSSSVLLLLNEYRNRRIFKNMPRIQIEKREALCEQIMPFLKNAKDKNRYLAKQAGWDLSGTMMGFLRLMALLLSIVLGGLVILTNQNVKREEIMGNMSIGKSFIELQTGGGMGENSRKQEREKLLWLEKRILPKRIRKGGAPLYAAIRELQGQRLGQANAGEFPEKESRRLGLKLMLLYGVKHSKEPWIGLSLISIGIYLLPMPLGWIKGSLQEKRKRDEIVRLYEAMLLYGELPPYEIKSLLRLMLHSSFIYRAVLSKCLEGLKAGYGEKILGFEMKNAAEEKDWGLADLLGQLKTFYISGMLIKGKDLDRIISEKTKLEVIFQEKSRNGKIQLSVVPFAVIIGVGAWYFMIGTMSLSNLSILGR